MGKTPKSNKSTGRNYRNEYDAYQGSAKQKKRRAQRNAARNKLMKTGAVKKGDGLDVDHKDNNTANNSRKNLSVKSKSANRSYARTKTAGVKKKKPTTKRKKK